MSRRGNKNKRNKRQTTGVKNPQTTPSATRKEETPEQVLDSADLVTEMKPVKHYFEKGVPARIGIVNPGKVVPPSLNIDELNK